MKRHILRKPFLLFSASAVLLLMSTVGSTRAALTYYSEDYMLEVSVPSIGVSLMENEKIVSHRNYENDRWSSDGEGVLLSEVPGEGESFKPGKRYEEELCVLNSGDIDSYVRVILCRSWKDSQGIKDTALSPELIGLELSDGENGWYLDESASTPERLVLYYTSPLASGQRTPAFCSSLTVSSEIGSMVTEHRTKDQAGNQIITTTCKYDGYQFSLEAEADAVQTHNAADAIKSAWGIDVTVGEDGSIRLP